MAFIKLNPAPVKKPGAFRVSVINRSRKSIEFQLQITISSSEFTTLFGDKTAFDVMRGEGPDQGLLLISPNPDGPFKPAFLKHCVIFKLPSDEFTPQCEISAEDPERKKTNDGLRILMPEWSWNPAKWKSLLEARDIAKKQNAAAQAQMSRKDTMAHLGNFRTDKA